MNMIMVCAHFDGELVRLDEPVEIVPDTPLFVLIPQPGADEDEERADWMRLAEQALARAYGDEPEYTLDMIREWNPKYDGR
jgi:hypothetical protein